MVDFKKIGIITLIPSKILFPPFNEFIIRILKDDQVKLSYIPEILIYMFYGGTTTSGVQAYKKSIIDSIKSLEENHIRFPRIITLKRFIRTAFQFINYKSIQVDIENKE